MKKPFTKLAAIRVLFAILVISGTAFGQTESPQTDSGRTQSLPGSPAPVAPSQAGTVYDRPVSWKLILPNIVDDQAKIWTFPVTLAKGHNWIPTLAIVGTGAALVLLDPKEAAWFRDTSAFHGFNNVFTSKATSIGMIVGPVSLYAAGFLRKDEKMQKTALLAGEAAADAEIVTTALKYATRRLRPAGFTKSGNLGDSWYDGGGGAGSFPSGHTIVAFSLATVVARRYGNHRWVPYAAYGLASAVAFSRLTLSAHFLSDVFIGGALGYSMSRFAVLRQ